MSSDTALKEELKEETKDQATSGDQSEDQNSSSSDSLQSESNNESQEDNLQEASSQEDYSQLLENIEKKLKWCESELCVSEKLNFINIKLTDIKEVRKRFTLLEKDHSDINFLFEYLINLNKRKKKLTEK